MSQISAVGVEAPALPADRFSLRTRVSSLTIFQRELLFGILAVLAAGSAAIPILGDVVEQPGGLAALIAWSCIAFVFAGLTWWRARPQSPFGPFLAVFGLATAVIALQGSDNGLLFSIGVFADAPIALLIWYALLAFPLGRLDRRGRLLMGVAAGIVVFGFLPKSLLSPHIFGATPFARCTDACPVNRFLIADEPSVAAVARGIEEWGRIAFTLLLLATLGQRFVRASRSRRRIVLPVYLVAVLWLFSFAAYNSARLHGSSTSVYLPFGLSVSFTRALLPLGFVAAIVYAYAHAGSALQTMVRELRADASAGHVQEIVRRVLDDPSARLAFWQQPSARYVDQRGRAVELPAAATGQSWRAFGRNDGEPVVAIIHDAALDGDPELVGAVGDATVLALENRRLGRDLQRSVDDLRLSRKRLVTAVAGERRRIERDLHDGAQQQLLAVRIRLELAREGPDVDPATHARLGELGEQLDHALDDLRSIAHGIYPAVLAGEGLRAALFDVASHSQLPVEVASEPLPKLPEEVAAAAYFTCVEALQNAAKHAGRYARCHVRVWSDGPTLFFEVADDGQGFSPSNHVRGSGLMNMTDRVAALGGALTIESEPGHGTAVRGTIPLGSNDR